MLDRGNDFLGFSVKVQGGVWQVVCDSINKCLLNACDMPGSIQGTQWNWDLCKVRITELTWLEEGLPCKALLA